MTEENKPANTSEVENKLENKPETKKRNSKPRAYEYFITHKNTEMLLSKNIDGKKNNLEFEVVSGPYKTKEELEKDIQVLTKNEVLKSDTEYSIICATNTFSVEVEIEKKIKVIL